MMKTNGRKKATAVVAVLLAGAMLLGGCQSGEGTSSGTGVEVSTPGEFPITQEKTALSIFVPKPLYIEDLNTNEFTKWYEDKTNVQIEWQVAAGDTAQAKNVMLASGNYPDIIMDCYTSRSEQLVYGEQGIFIDLTQLIDQKTKYIKQMLEERPDTKTAMTTPGGEIFGLPKINEVFHKEYAGKMWVYKPWLDKLGIKEPQTTEEFYQMLKAFKEKDPNGNGKADEIPLASTSTAGPEGIDQFLLNSFVYWNQNWTKIENEKISFTANTEEFREGLRYLHRLYEEGLMAKDSLIMDRKARTALGENPDVPILGAAPALWYGMFTVPGGDSGRSNDYIAISPLEGPTGLRQSPKAVSDDSGKTFNITKSCKNPAVAIRWADWFYSMEGTLTSQCGLENVGWKRAEEGQKGLDGNQALWEDISGFGTLQNVCWSNLGVYKRDEKIRIGIVADGEDPSESILYQATKEKYEPYSADKTPPNLYFDQQQSTEFTSLVTQLESEITKSFTAFVSGEKSLDTDWDSYVERLKTLGSDRYVELYQTVYDINHQNK